MSQTLTPTQQAAAMIAAAMAAPEEGFSAGPYQDVRGVWTFLYGSIYDLAGNRVTANTPPGTKQQGLQLLARDMTNAIIDIVKVTKVPINQNQLAALADFVYNLGEGTYNGSTLLKKLNAGDYGGAAAEIDLFDHAGGKVFSGLLRRRQLETLTFDKPVTPSAPVQDGQTISSIFGVGGDSHVPGVDTGSVTAPMVQQPVFRNGPTKQTENQPVGDGLTGTISNTPIPIPIPPS